MDAFVGGTVKGRGGIGTATAPFAAVALAWLGIGGVGLGVEPGAAVASVLGRLRAKLLAFCIPTPAVSFFFHSSCDMTAGEAPLAVKAAAKEAADELRGCTD